MEFSLLENPGAEWDEFVSRHTDQIFCRSVWSEVIRCGLGGHPYCMSLRSGDGIVSGMPGVLLSYYGIKLYYSAIPYGGYLGADMYFDDFIGQFLVHTSDVDALYLLPDSQDRTEAYEAYFGASPEVATRIDLRGQTLAQIQSRYQPSVRQSLNKGARHGVSVRRSRDRESFILAYRLYLQTMQRKRAIARYPQRWFEALHALLARDGLASVYLAEHQGETVSATVVISFGKSCHLMHSGSCSAALHLRANDLVVDAIIRDAHGEGVEQVDFLLSASNDSTLIHWKEKFGGESSRLNKFSRINSPFKLALWNGAKRLFPVVHRVGRAAGMLRR